MKEPFGVKKQEKQISEDGFKIKNIPTQIDRKNIDMVSRIDSITNRN